MQLRDAAEIVALTVFNAAEQDGRTITLADCESAIDALGGHPDGCPCKVCRHAGRIKPGRVYSIASTWQHCIRARSVRGAR